MDTRFEQCLVSGIYGSYRRTGTRTQFCPFSGIGYAMYYSYCNMGLAKKAKKVIILAHITVLMSYAHGNYPCDCTITLERMWLILMPCLLLMTHFALIFDAILEWKLL